MFSKNPTPDFFFKKDLIQKASCEAGIMVVIEQIYIEIILKAFVKIIE